MWVRIWNCELNLSLHSIQMNIFVSSSYLAIISALKLSSGSSKTCVLLLMRFALVICWTLTWFMLPHNVHSILQGLTEVRWAREASEVSGLDLRQIDVILLWQNKLDLRMRVLHVISQCPRFVETSAALQTNEVLLCVIGPLTTQLNLLDCSEPVELP